MKRARIFAVMSESGQWMDMAETPDQLPRSNANIADKLSRAYSSYLPSEPDQVPFFLNDAAWAVGCSDAEFARMLGISRATFSGWKARRSIPQKYLDWFASADFINAIIGGGSTTKLPFKKGGVDTVLFFLHRYDFEIFGLHFPESIWAAGTNFPGLCSLAQFLQWRLPLADNPDKMLEPAIECMRILLHDNNHSDSSRPRSAA